MKEKIGTLKNFFIKMLFLVNVLVILGMLVTGNAGFFSPKTFPLLSTLGYAFPAFVIADIVMIMVWVCVRLRMLIVPFAGFLVCYSPMMTFCPVHLEKKIPENSIKVMTYNTWMLGVNFENTCETPREERRKAVLKYIAESDCDIVCLQETEIKGDVIQEVHEIIKPVMGYVDTCYGPGGTCVSLFSKHPILRHERIEYASAGNISAAFYVNINGRETLVINNHLETNHFSIEEKEQFHTMMKGGMHRKDMRSESKFVLRKLGDAAALRAPQAEAVAQYIRMHKGMPMIVCGDFNDIPLSYAHRIIAKNLTDCFINTATGPGFSYRKNGMYVRIDNILCSDEFTPFACFVDKSIDISDHFPLISYIK